MSLKGSSHGFLVLLGPADATENDCQGGVTSPGHALGTAHGAGGCEDKGRTLRAAEGRLAAVELARRSQTLQADGPAPTFRPGAAETRTRLRELMKQRSVVLLQLTRGRPRVTLLSRGTQPRPVRLCKDAILTQTAEGPCPLGQQPGTRRTLS